ncbi:uncharacterized protein LOC118470478 [Amphiprion ocellaris]|uniref:Sterile alpha motif domain-containing 3-like n=1 Tax=Amphiprion ocellaris TaxID=80972 RepID=A0AAQ5YL75_AMPOC|nr:uncharacterized protein LOC118470478 [Amphiprion ocellaris]XP_054870454.1 uncharacterized protein LOC118470478 [Amphiprion ocellaris]
MNSSGNQTNSLSPLSRYWRSISEWPDPFPIPTLSLDVELKLRKGNESYESNKIGIDVSRDMKIEILDKIAQAAFDIKAYPDHDELESIALALIAKYPCLKEPGRGKGYEGWLVSIRNKLNNYRAKLREAGCSEVSVNKKRKADGDVTKYTLKRAKRGEVNHVPEHPEQHDDASLEEQRLLLVEASKKARFDHSFIREKMDLTFSLRRREIVEEQPMVMEIQTRWPALFFKEQICEEFFRITNKELLGIFRAAVDEYTPKLLRLYRARKGAFGKDMENLLEKLDDETSNIVRHRKDAALRGLPVFLRDEPKELFKQCLESDREDESTKEVAVGILFVVEDCVATTSSAVVQNIAVVLEETIVLEDVPDLPSALAYLFGLLYALNISYPKALKYTFETFQHIFMEMGSDCTQRVRSLKNKLLL